MGKKKEKKEKIRYYDDGSTVADMSGVKDRRLPGGDPLRPRATYKEKWDTYWHAVKMMFLPMLFFLGILTVLYMIASLLLLIL